MESNSRSQSPDTDNVVNSFSGSTSPAKKRKRESNGQDTISSNISEPLTNGRIWSRINESTEHANKRLEKMCDAVRTLLECVGEDPNREGLLATPLRYAKALLFFTEGYNLKVENVVNNAFFHDGHNEIVVVKDIEIHSLCEHHLVPFIGKMHIGYIPSATVIGLSKLPRIAQVFSRRLQIQERLTREVAHATMEILNPLGVAVAMESSHLCMIMRGVEKTSSTTITSCMLGSFESKSEMRDDFFRLAGFDRT